MKQTFRKNERLKSRTLLNRVFSEGRSLNAYPLRLLWLEAELPEDVPVQFAFSVPKRHFKNAVERNLLKRRIREAVRLNKSRLCEAAGMNDRQYALMVIFTAREGAPYNLIEAKICEAFDRLIKNP